MKLFLIRPRGFCAGVIRAISTVENALIKYGAPVFVKHQIVHNRHVVKALEAKGAIFVEDLTKIPRGSVVIFSAHGVTPQVREEACELDLKIVDATCPLVAKLHASVIRYAKKGYKIILIGKKKHVEIEGIYQEAPQSITVIEKLEDIKNIEFSNEQKLIYLSQTTLSLLEIEKFSKALKERFPQIESLPSSSICYATTNRQKALMEVSKKCDLIIVVGDPNSSNSNRLKECSESLGVNAYLINNSEEIDPSWFVDVENIGMSAGASTPEYLVKQCLTKLQELGVSQVEEDIQYLEDGKFNPPNS